MILKNRKDQQIAQLNHENEKLFNQNQILIIENNNLNKELSKYTDILYVYENIYIPKVTEPYYILSKTILHDTNQTIKFTSIRTNTKVIDAIISSLDHHKYQNGYKLPFKFLIDFITSYINIH